MTDQLMQAAICTRYGPPEVLQIKQVPKPVPKGDELLVRIMASAVNSGDVRVRGLAVTGFLRIVMRLVLGFSGPRKHILGTVFSGIIEETGPQAGIFKKGDRVFGMTGFQFGTHADYICLPEKSNVTTMPRNASFEEAAALPFGANTATYFLRRAGIETAANPKVLIYGASGSVGAAAVQIARHYHAAVTAVCGVNGRALLQRLGVTDIICYQEEDFTKYAGKFDIVFDAVGKISKKQCRHLLAKGGRYVTVGGLVVAAEHISQLELVKQLFEEGAYHAAIDSVYDFEDIIEAHRYAESGRKKGDLVVRLFK